MRTPDRSPLALKDHAVLLLCRGIEEGNYGRLDALKGVLDVIRLSSPTKPCGLGPGGLRSGVGGGNG